MFNFALRAAAACALLLSTAFVRAARPRSASSPTPSASPTAPTLAAERGTFTVPEDRSDPALAPDRDRLRPLPLDQPQSRRADRLSRRRAGRLGRRPPRAGRASRSSSRLRQVADVIALDQRGTGLSNHIPPCTAERRLDPAAGAQRGGADRLLSRDARRLRRALARRRRRGERLHDRAERRRSSRICAARSASARLDLWGISYGTHLGDGDDAPPSRARSAGSPSPRPRAWTRR